MFFYIVSTQISTTSGLSSIGNTRKYHQIDVYIYQCVHTAFDPKSSYSLLSEKRKRIVPDMMLLHRQADMDLLLNTLFLSVLFSFQTLDWLK